MKQRQLSEYLDITDILYMTRVQQERFNDPIEYENVKECLPLEAQCSQTCANLKILHPLPELTRLPPMWMTLHMHIFQTGRKRNVRKNGHHSIFTGIQINRESWNRKINI